MLRKLIVLTLITFIILPVVAVVVAFAHQSNDCDVPITACNGYQACRVTCD